MARATREEEKMVARSALRVERSPPTSTTTPPPGANCRAAPTTASSFMFPRNFQEGIPGTWMAPIATNATRR